MIHDDHALYINYSDAFCAYTLPAAVYFSYEVRPIYDRHGSKVCTSDWLPTDVLHAYNHTYISSM